MDNKMKVTTLVVGGYLLGRTKKLKLALTVAGAVSGSKIYSNRDQIQEAVSKFTGSTPEFGRLSESAQALLTGGIDRASAALQERTEKINTSLDEAAAQAKDAAGGETSETEDEAEEDVADQTPAKDEKPKSSGRRTSGTKSRSSSSSSSRKSSSKSQGAKR